MWLCAQGPPGVSCSTCAQTDARACWPNWVQPTILPPTMLPMSNCQEFLTGYVTGCRMHLLQVSLHWRWSLLWNPFSNGTCQHHGSHVRPDPSYRGCFELCQLRLWRTQGPRGLQGSFFPLFPLFLWKLFKESKILQKCLQRVAPDLALHFIYLDKKNGPIGHEHRGPHEHVSLPPPTSQV